MAPELFGVDGNGEPSKALIEGDDGVIAELMAIGGLLEAGGEGSLAVTAWENTTKRERPNCTVGLNGWRHTTLRRFHFCPMATAHNLSFV